MCNVARPVAHPSLSQREYLAPEQISASAAEEGAISAFMVLFAECRVHLYEVHDQVSSDIIWTLIGFVLICDPYALGHALLDVQLMGFRFADYPAAVTDGTRVFNCLALAMAGVALHLYLLEESWSKLLPPDHSTASTTSTACLYVAVCRSRTFTCRANRLLFDRKFSLAPIVEVTQGNSDTNFHIGAPSFSALVSKMTRTTEEAREEVEGVVALTGAVALLVLFDALVAILIVDLACLYDAEDIVGFGDCDELLVGRIIPTELGLVELTKKAERK